MGKLIIISNRLPVTVSAQGGELEFKPSAGEWRDRLVSDYASTRRRLLLLDYDGTLVPFADRPEDATPTSELIDLLQLLATDTANEVVILSGRDRDSLSAWLGDLPVRLVAEHGAWARGKSGAEWHIAGEVTDGWKEQIRPVLERYVERIPGSLIEEKTLSLAWHYRKADIGIATLAARELIDGLTNLTANAEIGVLQGHKVVEVKSENITKGGYYRTQLSRHGWDFVLAIGDDWTDETLFSVLPEDAWSIKVGFGPSAAQFMVASPAEVHALLKHLQAAAGQAR